MLKNKKMLRFFGLLAGLAALVIVWLVVIQPLTSPSQDDNIADETENEDSEGGLDGAIVSDHDRPAINLGDEDNEGSDNVAVGDTTTTPPASDMPSELTVTGPAGLSIISVLGIVAATYLFFFNRQVKKAAKSLTYLQR
jgi:hypothetical protein